MITLQFSAQNKIGSILIQKFTWSPYSHVDFVLPDGKLLGARADGVKIREPEAFDKTLRLEVNAPESVLNWARLQIGKPYDWGAIVGFLARHDWSDDSAWFCSEFVAWSFACAGVPLLRTTHTSRITPRDLLLSPLLLSQNSIFDPMYFAEAST